MLRTMVWTVAALVRAGVVMVRAGAVTVRAGAVMVRAGAVMVRAGAEPALPAVALEAVRTLGEALEQGWGPLLSTLFSQWTPSLHPKYPQWQQLGHPQEQRRLVHLSDLPLDQQAHPVSALEHHRRLWSS